MRTNQKKYLTNLIILFFVFPIYSNTNTLLEGKNSLFFAKKIKFTENKGQLHDQDFHPLNDVLFSGEDGGFDFYLRSTGISYQLYKTERNNVKSNAKKKENDVTNDLKSMVYRFDINWINANKKPDIIKINPIDGFDNYYLKNCPNGVLNVQSYSQLLYKNVYAGIDMKWYEKDGSLEYDYIVKPGSDYRQIKFQVIGVADVIINDIGELVYSTPFGKIIEKSPIASQGGKVLKAKWKITNGIISFEILNSNPNEEIIIDPAIRSWGTYVGFGCDAKDCTTDLNGNVYLVGQKDGNSQTGLISTVGAHLVATTAPSGYIIKFNSSGVRQWGTLYGGGNFAVIANSCATDANGNVFVVGTFTSYGFTSNLIVPELATPGSHQTYLGTLGGGSGSASDRDAFLVKFNSSGVRQWGTIYGNGLDNWGKDCSVDPNGNVIIVGETYSMAALSTPGSHQPSATPGGSMEGFIAKFNTAGVRQWGTCYGGSGVDKISSCASDLNGNIYVSGNTSTSSGTAIASSNGHQSFYGGGSSDAFLAKFDATGTRQWATYYGGSGDEGGGSGGLSSWLFEAGFCATDATGNVYLTGFTNMSAGTSIATANSHQSGYGGGTYDSYLVKFSASGSRQWGTYVGGANIDLSQSCTTDASGNIYIAGMTDSNNSQNIYTASGHQTLYGGGQFDAFLVKFTSSGLRQRGTYYGGIGFEYLSSCATDINGAVYIAGITSTQSNNTFVSNDIATNGSHMQFSTSSSNAFLAKLNDCTSPLVTVTNTTICAGQNVIITPSGASSYTYATNSSTVNGVSISVSPSITTNYSITGTSNSGCVSTSNFIMTITVNPNPTLSINNGTICSGETFTINPIGANSFTIEGGSAIVNPSVNSTYTVIGANASTGCTSSVYSVSIIVDECVGLSSQSSPNKLNSIFPNPNNGEFTVELHSVNNGYLTIINAVGQIIVYQRADLLNKINIKKFEKGIYFVSVSEDNKIIYRSSFIKE